MPGTAVTVYFSVRVQMSKPLDALLRSTHLACTDMVTLAMKLLFPASQERTEAYPIHTRGWGAP